jgi:UDP-N-acetylmuramyl-tripeptide synthetase
MINITADSRKVKKGDVFVALRGISRDGHIFINDAIKRGASKIVAEEGTYDIPYEIVPDSRNYLKNYLKENYVPKISKMKFIGVTGTNGKTTTAFLIHEILNKLGIKTAYIGTVGFYIDKKICSIVNGNTCPDLWDSFDLFMEAYEAGCEYIVEEVSSEGLTSDRIELYEFDAAIFMNLTRDHLNTHKTMENYALAKQMLFKKLKKNGLAIVNSDDSYKDYFLLNERKNITVGFEQADYKVKEYKTHNQGSDFTYLYEDKEYEVKSKLLGKFSIYNLLASISVLEQLNIKIEDILKIIPQLKSPVGRMDTVLYKDNSIIIDYAHAPDSLEKIIETAKDICKGKIYTIFGCTGDRDRTKRPIMMGIATSLSDYVIVTNDDPHNEDPERIVEDILKNNEATNYEVCLDRKKAIKKGIDLLKSEDILLILGKGHEEYMIIMDRKIEFNDKKMVKAYLEKLENK